MENICATLPQLNEITFNCLKNEEEEFKQTNYFSLYQEDLLYVHEFCSSCKIYFMSLETFNLKKIVIYDRVIR